MIFLIYYRKGETKHKQCLDIKKNKSQLIQGILTDCIRWSISNIIIFSIFIIFVRDGCLCHFLLLMMEGLNEKRLNNKSVGLNSLSSALELHPWYIDRWSSLSYAEQRNKVNREW